MQYNTGTCSVTNGSTTVTGVGTAWIANVRAGDIFSLVGSKVPYFVASDPVSDTSLTLTANYGGTTASTQAYAITTSITPSLKLPYMEQGDIDTATIFKAAMTKLDTSLGGLFTGTAGAVLFISSAGVVGSDSTKFFWDNTNKRLGLGSASPGNRLTVQADSSSSGYGNPVLVASNAGDVNFVIGFGAGDGSAHLETTSAHSLTLNVPTGALHETRVNNVMVTRTTSAGFSVTGIGTFTDTAGAVQVKAAYSGTAYSFLGHNNTNGYCGTFTNHPFILRTNNTDAITISTGQAVTVAGSPASALLAVAQSNNAGNDAMTVANSAATATNQYGLKVTLTGDPNDATRYFYSAIGNATVRARIYSDGGFSNYQANDVNLSDEGSKKDFTPYDDDFLDRVADAVDQIEFGRYKYLDQTHDDWNHGTTAQSVERAMRDVAPELIAEWRANPYWKGKGIYAHDLGNIAIAALRHKNRRLESRLKSIESRLGM